MHCHGSISLPTGLSIGTESTAVRQPRFVSRGDSDEVTLRMSCDPDLARFDGDQSLAAAVGADVVVRRVSAEESIVTLRREPGRSTAVRLDITATSVADGDPVTESFWIRPVAAETIVVSPPTLNLSPNQHTGTVIVRGIHGEQVVGVEAISPEGVAVEVSGDITMNFWRLVVETARDCISPNAGSIELHIALRDGGTVTRSIQLNRSESGP